MTQQMIGRFKMNAARMAHGGGKGHLFRHSRIADLGLHSARSPKLWLPRLRSTRGKINVTAEGSLIGVNLFSKAVVMVGQKPLAHGDIELTLVFRHDLIPAETPSIGTHPPITYRKFRLFMNQLFVDWKIRACEITILATSQVDVFEAELKAGNLVGLAISHQPVISIATIVSICHDPREIVDGRGILHGLASPHKFRNSVRVPAEKPRDGGFCDQHTGGVHSKVVGAVDQARESIHQDPMPLNRDQIEDDVPTLSVEVSGPGVMPDHHSPVLGVTASGHKRAAPLSRCNHSIL